ncbi:hypothetical protein F310043J5_28060 [Anaerostipes hominis (ex Lee et al. 2021)]
MVFVSTCYLAIIDTVYSTFGKKKGTDSVDSYRIGSRVCTEYRRLYGLVKNLCFWYLFLWGYVL